MRNLVSITVAFFLAGCISPGGVSRPKNDPNLLPAEAFIDAFYSFDPARLRNALAFAEKSIPQIFYYQGWAQGGNYRIVNRMPCQAKSTKEVTCSITVKDDLLGALGIPFNVTDTFHISLNAGKISAVKTSSNDPQAVYDAQEWVKRERPELLRVPCQGVFDRGPTPGECIKAMVRGLKEFAALKGTSQFIQPDAASRHELIQALGADQCVSLPYVLFALTSKSLRRSNLDPPFWRELSTTPVSHASTARTAMSQ